MQSFRVIPRKVPHFQRYMPKVKTHQGTAKRIKKTKTGKLIARSVGQDHFNSRESGKTTTNKRRDLILSKTHNKLKSLIPYK